MNSKIDNYIEFKKNQRLLDRVYFMFALEDCLQYQQDNQSNFEGFIINRHQYDLKNMVSIKIKREAFAQEIDNESINLLKGDIKTCMHNLKKLMDIFSSDTQFANHLGKCFEKNQPNKFYLDSTSISDFKPKYLNGEAYSLYEKIIIEEKLNSEMRIEENNKKPLKI